MFWNKDKKNKVPSYKENEHNNDNDRFVTQYHGYCRTIALAHENDPRPIYWEIFCQPKTIDQWQLRQVMARTKEHKTTGTDIKYNNYKTLQKGLDFQNAVHKLAQFERATGELNRYAVGKTAEELGIKHFIIVTEQEGLLFDEKGYPHKILLGHIPQTDGNFLPDDVKHAVKSFDSVKDLEKISKLENDTTTILSRIFNIAVSKTAHYEAALNSINDLKTLDTFHKLLNLAASKMNSIKNTDDIGFYDNDWQPIKGSVTLKKMRFKKYVVKHWAHDNTYQVKDMPHYFSVLNILGVTYQNISALSKDNPLKQPILDTTFLIEATYNIVYAQYLFERSIQKSNTTENYTADIRALQECAEEIFKTKLSISDREDIEAIKNLIIQGNTLDTPKIIENYLSGYQNWRHDIKNNNTENIEQRVSETPQFPKLSSFIKT